LRGAVNGTWVADIHREGADVSTAIREARGLVRDGLAIDVRHEHARADSGKCVSDRKADPACRARDNGTSPFELLHQVLLSTAHITSPRASRSSALAILGATGRWASGLRALPSRCSTQRPQHTG